MISSKSDQLKIQEYLLKNTGHRIKKYDFKPELIDSVNQFWGKYFDKLGYKKLNS